MIPTLQDLASDPLTHRYGDLFNPPALTNFHGCVGAALDVTGITSLSFPPFSSGEATTGTLRINRRHAQAMGAAVTFQWFPDRIEREAIIEGLRVRSTTVMPADTMGVVVAVEVENMEGSTRDIQVGWSSHSAITKSVTNWSLPVPPAETDNQARVEPSLGRVVFTARQSDAVAIQGGWPAPDLLTPAQASYTLRLAPGERYRYWFFWVVDDDVSLASKVYDQMVNSRDDQLEHAATHWEGELAALFTPHNDRYSGHLPGLQIDDPGIQKIYWMGALGVAYFRRDSRYSRVGRVYDTLMPRYWQAAMVLWDYSLSGTCHAMLDPDVMRATLLRWMSTDIHKHFGTCYLTGDPIGPWYAVNDYAMASMVHQYVTWSGDRGWLETQVGPAGQCVIDYVVEFATSWKQFEQPDGLAGYGGLFNLLECVSSYVHEVASLNAANVKIMRQAAELLEILGRDQAAGTLRSKATALWSRLQTLYVERGGYWYARQRDGTVEKVRHAYDLLTVLNCVPDDLTATQKTEMTRFFVDELQTDTWMYALSPKDTDATFSLRPDHQWNGAYPAWPPETAKGLFRIGESAIAYRWLQGLAHSANQGPFGQAHFVETAMPPESGGARKASAEAPFINDWHSSSSGSWVSAVLEGALGIHTAAAGTLTADFCSEAVARGAVVTHLPFQGKLYRVDAEGVHLE